MSAGKSALFVALLFCLLKHVDSQDVTVKSGEDATLECYGPRDATVGILKWRKPDLKSESYVFLFRENSIIEKYQDPSFKDRVKLRDPEMKKGDFSVIVKSVTTNDSGIYECYAGYNNQEPNLINRTSLKVEGLDVTVKSGENATLECYGPRDATVGILKWRKPDLKSESYVFFFRENSIVEKYQDPSFKDRVKLRGPEMKNGDFSVIVKSVTTNDSGIYECYAGYNNQEPNLINRTSLKFEGLGQQGEQGGDGTEGDGKQEDGTEGDGDKAGSVGLKAGVLVAVPVLGVIAAVVGSVIYRRCRNQQNQDNII